jgi:fucokinase
VGALRGKTDIKPMDTAAHLKPLPDVAPACQSGRRAESHAASIPPACGRAIAAASRELYAACVGETASAPRWWTAVVVTASSEAQARSYESEIDRRRRGGKLPRCARFLVVPDPGGRRIGSGTATLAALRAVASPCSPATLGPEWWAGQRVLVIHSGGDSRRLPQYSVAGKLFTALPGSTPWGDPSTLFDETLALSTPWVHRFPSGVLVAAGDVLLTFPAAGVDWERGGITGVAMIQPFDVGAQHGVYVVDAVGQVTSFLQKPSRQELAAARGFLGDDSLALDTGLLRFSPDVAARLARLSDAPEFRSDEPPAVDLYRHLTMALTRQWAPVASDSPALHRLAETLADLPFHCSVVEGEFTHVGTTALFRKLLFQPPDADTADSLSASLNLPNAAPAAAVVDCALPGGFDPPSGVALIECHLSAPVQAAAGAMLHGVDDPAADIRIPPGVVVHQLPVCLGDGRRAVVLRLYGVDDDPKAPLDAASWLGAPILDSLRRLGIDSSLVWPSAPDGGRTLWNACLFPAVSPSDAWQSLRWLLGEPSAYSLDRWASAERLSLATSALLADTAALDDARLRRIDARWRRSALALVDSGSDIRPLLAHPPAPVLVADTAAAIEAAARRDDSSAPTEAARRHCAAGRFYVAAGLSGEADQAYRTAFDCVARAVDLGIPVREFSVDRWRFRQVTVEAPARLDFGGGWSDTPPFCLDWGGTVLNAAVLLEGAFPIRTTIRRISDPLIRCISSQTGTVSEYRTSAELLAPPAPGDEFAIPRTALRVAGLCPEDGSLASLFRSLGGGLEISTEVNLPMGSGLGTSSILAAATMRALFEMIGVESEPQTLWDTVMRIEQLMSTGGGWQDQAGGAISGMKLLSTGPGLHQRIRVQPVACSALRQAELQERLVVYYTGIRRVARDLLRQVVARYLHRETTAVQVLHAIKTFAVEMSFAIDQGEWEHLGELIDRHWELNQILDPHTTNSAIESLLESVRPYVYGAKLAGAGGGGFLILLARNAASARDLRSLLARRSAAGGALYACRIALDGFRIDRQ